MTRLLITLLFASSVYVFATQVKCDAEFFKPLDVYTKVVLESRCIQSEMEMGNNAMSGTYMVTPGAQAMFLKLFMFEGDKVTKIMAVCGKTERPHVYACTEYWFDTANSEWHRDPKQKFYRDGEIADIYFSSMLVKAADERYLFFNQNPPWAQ